HANEVTDSVLRVVDHYATGGDDLAIIAPGWRGTARLLRTTGGRGVPVHRIASLPLAGRTEVRLAPTSATALRRRIAAFQPAVVHLASPTILGGRAMVAAQKDGEPTAAVCQSGEAGHFRRP